MSRWAVFLDRDGVLNEDAPLISRPEDLRLLPGVPAALARLKEAAALLIVVTNQPVVARGLVDEAGLGGIHRRLEELLAQGGARLDALFYCPHHPETHHPEARDPRYRRECDCRKPKIGMIQDAIGRFDINLPDSFLIGDRTLDIQTARNAGCRAVLVRTGMAGKDGQFPDVRPDASVANLPEAADWILSNRSAAHS